METFGPSRSYNFILNRSSKNSNNFQRLICDPIREKASWWRPAQKRRNTLTTNHMRFLGVQPINANTNLVLPIKKNVNVIKPQG